MRTRKKLALDSDGFLSNFTAGALLVVKEVTGRSYAEADVTMFDFAKALGLSAEESRAVKDIIGSRQGFCASLAPYPGAREGVRQLREFGDVFCVTTPWDSNPWWRSERESWLALHIGIDEVEHKVDKSDVDADVFVDDKASHVRDWLVKHPDGCGVFWQTLHNTSEAVPYGAHVIGNFKTLYQVVREHFLGPKQQAFALPQTPMSCRGEGCPRADLCRRHMEASRTTDPTYFVTTPVQADGLCAEFVSNGWVRADPSRCGGAHPLPRCTWQCAIEESP